MKRLRYWLRSLFGYSHTETNGFLVLCLLIVWLLLVPAFYPLLFPPRPFDHSADHRQLDSLVAELEQRQPEQKPAYRSEPAAGPRREIALFDFDPNAISAETWQSLGLPKYLAERIIKYRGKGGKFRTKGDVKKIYGFPEELYARLHKHILLPDSLQRHAPHRPYPRKGLAFAQYDKSAEKKPFDKQPFHVEPFDINRADTVQLASVRGIGPSLSRRIARYRDLLGGFSGKHQLYEVYGLDSTVVEELLRKGFLGEAAGIRKLRINQATEQELDAHPYISPRLARIIVAYRVQHGNFGSAEDLKPIKILDEATLLKLSPYLSFE
jgi:DNA uptake protein ComE-like DNA-binding protein